MSPFAAAAAAARRTAAVVANALRAARDGLVRMCPTLYSLRDRLAALDPRHRARVAANVIRRHWGVRCFYLDMTYRVFNPTHNGGTGQWHTATKRFGPLGPARLRDVPTYATVDLVRVSGNYPEDVLVRQQFACGWRFE